MAFPEVMVEPRKGKTWQHTSNFRMSWKGDRDTLKNVGFGKKLISMDSAIDLYQIPSYSISFGCIWWNFPYFLKLSYFKWNHHSHYHKVTVFHGTNFCKYSSDSLEEWLIRFKRLWAGRSKKFWMKNLLLWERFWWAWFWHNRIKKGKKIQNLLLRQKLSFFKLSINYNVHKFWVYSNILLRKYSNCFDYLPKSL